MSASISVTQFDFEIFFYFVVVVCLFSDQPTLIHVHCASPQPLMLLNTGISIFYHESFLPVVIP